MLKSVRTPRPSSPSTLGSCASSRQRRRYATNTRAVGNSEPCHQPHASKWCKQGVEECSSDKSHDWPHFFFPYSSSLVPAEVGSERFWLQRTSHVSQAT